MDTLDRIRRQINEQRKNSFDDYEDEDNEENHTDLREATDDDAPTSSYDEWLVAAAEGGFDPSPDEQTDPDVLVVTSSGIKER